MRRLGRLFRKSEMDCTEVRDRSSEYLEGDLTPSRLQKFRTHIANCGPCQTFVDGLASVVGMLTKLPPAETPPKLKQSIMEQVEGEERG